MSCAEKLTHRVQAAGRKRKDFAHPRRSERLATVDSQLSLEPSDGGGDKFGREFVAGVQEDQFFVGAGIERVNGLGVFDGAEFIGAAHDG